MRVDETGKLQKPVNMHGASRWLEKTFTGQTYLILDENDKPLGHIVTPEEPARVIIY